MDDKIISFIICVNNKVLYNSTAKFILSLNIPYGYKIEIIPIVNAKSMCNGYNKAINIAKGKYKVYMHQDVYILNRDIIQDVLNIFKNEEIGIIGVIGSKEISYSLVWWEAQTKIGKTYENRNNIIHEFKFNDIVGDYQEVSLLDGILLVTQYDILWREDILDGWHFYDISQCIEFLIRNKKVVIANQEQPWCIHNIQGTNSLDTYYKYRDILVNEYFEKKLLVQQ